MSAASGLGRKTAIAGIGATEFSKDSGRSELRLAVEAIAEALADCGLDPSEVDGMCSFTMENNPDNEIIRALGIDGLRFFSRTHYGGGAACATLHHAATAITAGAADVVVCYRAMNERSQQRFGAGVQNRASVPTTESAHFGWYAPFGLLTPAAWVAMFGQRYLYEYGHTTEAFGLVSVLSRKHAATNPHAMMYGRPVTMEDHQSSRWITEPLRLLDCTLDTDGASAVIVVSAEKAKQLKSTPAYIAAAAQGTGSRSEMMTSYQRDTLARLEESEATAAVLYPLAELEPKDIDVAEIYDPFTPMVLMQLEAYGFAEHGKSPALFHEGKLELDGETPMNTHGGHLGEGYLHGFGHIVEAVRQIRGTAVNQVPNVKTCLVTSGVGVPTSAMVLGQMD